MTAIMTESVNKAICRALGFEPDQVDSLTLYVEPGSAERPRVILKMNGTEEGGEKVAGLLNEYRLVRDDNEGGEK